MEDKQLTINGVGEKKMTLLEISRALNVEGRTIRKYVSKLFPGLMKNGVATFLDEEQVTLLKLEMQKNQHLERSFQVPKTELEKKLLVQQAMNILSEEVQELKSKLEEAQPKIEFHDLVETSLNSVSVAQFANLLTRNGHRIGQNNLFKWFYENRYLIDSDRPYQRSLDNGWFEINKVVYSDHYDRDRTAHKVLVTGKGQTYFAKKIMP